MTKEKGVTLPQSWANSDRAELYDSQAIVSTATGQGPTKRTQGSSGGLLITYLWTKAIVKVTNTDLNRQGNKPNNLALWVT